MIMNPAISQSVGGILAQRDPYRSTQQTFGNPGAPRLQAQPALPPTQQPSIGFDWGQIQAPRLQAHPALPPTQADQDEYQRAIKQLVPAPVTPAPNPWKDVVANPGLPWPKPAPGEMIARPAVQPIGSGNFFFDTNPNGATDPSKQPQAPIDVRMASDIPVFRNQTVGNLIAQPSVQPLPQIQNDLQPGQSWMPQVQPSGYDAQTSLSQRIATNRVNPQTVARQIATSFRF